MAIAFDASATVSHGGGPLTFSLTTTGLNIGLFVGLLANGTTQPTATYNGVSLSPTGMPTKASGNGSYTLYALFLAQGSGAGAQNVVVTSGGDNTDMYPIAASYTGCSQTGIPDATYADLIAVPVGAYALTWNTVADNAWQLGFVYNTNGITQVAGTSTTLRQDQAFNGVQLYDSNGARTPAGSNSLNLVGTGSGNETVAAFSIAPISVATDVIPLYQSLGGFGPHSYGLKI